MIDIEAFAKHLPGITEALFQCGDPTTIPELAEAIVRGEAQVWGDGDALLVTELGTDGVIHFWIATGKLEAVVRHSRRAMEWAKENGFTKASLTGRRGWVRALADEGWEERSVYMERTL